MKKFTTLFIAIILLISTAALAQTKDPAPLGILMGMDDAYAKINDYTATFIKQERVGGRILPEERTIFKFKKPFKVYMKWVGLHGGREAMFVRGENGERLVGHDTGLKGLITLNMDPKGSLAMTDNRHPITDVGIGRVIDFILGDVRLAVKNNEVNLKYIGEETVNGRKALHINGQAPAGHSKEYYARSIDVWVDKALGVPIKVIVYGWTGEFLERYEYSNLVVNKGIADAEFKRDFKDYDF